MACAHYSREERDFYLVLSKELIKLVMCKDCGKWLERVKPNVEMVVAKPNPGKIYMSEQPEE